LYGNGFLIRNQDLRENCELVVRLEDGPAKTARDVTSLPGNEAPTKAPRLHTQAAVPDDSNCSGIEVQDGGRALDE
jgi:hypothetical protein